MNGVTWVIREDLTPTDYGTWLVMIDGQRVALILESEQGCQFWANARPSGPVRSFREGAENDVRNHFLTWATQNSHPASGTRYQETVINGETWARVTVHGTVVAGPSRYADRMNKEFNRLYQKATEGL